MNVVMNVANNVKNLFSGHVIEDVIEKTHDCTFVQFKVNCSGKTTPVVTLQDGYDVVHGKFRQVSKNALIQLVSDKFNTQAYLLSKESCVSAEDIVTEISKARGCEIWVSEAQKNYTDTLTVMVTSPDGKTSAKVVFNGEAMNTWSYSTMRKQAQYKAIQGLGLIL